MVIPEAGPERARHGTPPPRAASARPSSIASRARRRSASVGGATTARAAALLSPGTWHSWASSGRQVVGAYVGQHFDCQQPELVREQDVVDREPQRRRHPGREGQEEAAADPRVQQTADPVHQVTAAIAPWPDGSSAVRAAPSSAESCASSVRVVGVPCSPQA